MRHSSRNKTFLGCVAVILLMLPEMQADREILVCRRRPKHTTPPMESPVSKYPTHTGHSTTAGNTPPSTTTGNTPPSTTTAHKPSTTTAPEPSTRTASTSTPKPTTTPTITTTPKPTTTPTATTTPKPTTIPTTTAAGPGDCSTYQAYNGNYKLKASADNDRRTADDAETECQKEGARLIHVKNGQVNAAVLELVNSLPADTSGVLLIGLKQFDVADYRWIGSYSVSINPFNGQPSDSSKFVNFKDAASYDGEFPPTRDDKDCFKVDRSQSNPDKWDDIRCDSAQRYICECNQE